MRYRIAACVVVGMILLAPTTSRADNGLGAALRELAAFTLLDPLPASVGFDTSKRFLLAWPHQLPLAPLAADAVSQRLVFTPRLTFPGPGANEGSPITFDARMGYRAVWHPGGRHVGGLAGLGSTTEFSPLFRPSVSPEIGAHVCLRARRKCELLDGAVLLVIQGDIFAAGKPVARGALSVGWAFY